MPTLPLGHLPLLASIELNLTEDGRAGKCGYKLDRGTKDASSVMPNSLPLEPVTT